MFYTASEDSSGSHRKKYSTEKRNIYKINHFTHTSRNIEAQKDDEELNSKLD